MKEENRKIISTLKEENKKIINDLKEENSKRMKEFDNRMRTYLQTTMAYQTEENNRLIENISSSLGNTITSSFASIMDKFILALKNNNNKKNEED